MTRTRLRWSDDTGSLPFAMLLTLIGISLSALMVPMVITQVNGTRLNIQRVHALHAAQAGIDVALGHIRAAQDGTGAGRLASLPCGPLTGTVSGGSTARYQVVIDYLDLDPQGQPDAWIATNRITCSPGGGTLTTPAFALMRALGTDQPTGPFSPGRALTATYIFQTSNQNIAGGLIHIYRTGAGTDLCLDGGSDSPAAGSQVVAQPCSAGSSQQKWAYNTNLTLALASSQTAAQPLGMCLDAGTPHSPGLVVLFQRCADTTLPQQQWSINDTANFEGTSDGRSLNGYCFNVQQPNTPGSFVVLGTGASGCRQGHRPGQTFYPEATVGAGAAGTSAGQLVNFKQFGRCLDVTEFNVNYGFLIDWPCKQAPDPVFIGWNQKWNLPTVANGATEVTGVISTNHPNGLHCLRSPGSTGPSLYVRAVPCPAAITPNETWTLYADTGSYATSYRIMDGYGYCLSVTDPAATPPDLYRDGSDVSKIIVENCSGSSAQKWNAPPNIAQPVPLKDINEK